MTYTLDELIKCAEREVEMRKHVYPRWVSMKKMSAARAEDEIAKMSRIASFLKTLQMALSTFENP